MIAALPELVARGALVPGERVVGVLTGSGLKAAQTMARILAGVSARPRAAIFAAIVPTIEGIAATFGRSCEVLVHDYRDPEHSRRRVLAPPPRRRGHNELNYLTRTETAGC